MSAELSAELSRAWADTERARAILRSVEWMGVESVYWDGITAACCPSCGGIKPGEDKYDSKTPFGHSEDCALVAALGPAPCSSPPKGGGT